MSKPGKTFNAGHYKKLKWSNRPARLFVVALLLGHLLPDSAYAQQQPFWISPTQIVIAEGFAILKWSVKGGDSVALFRISEEYAGEQQVSFTDQAQLRVVRTKPGHYSFSVQACKRYPDGFPSCGASSSQLTLSVGDVDAVSDQPNQPPVELIE